MSLTWHIRLNLPESNSLSIIYRGGRPVKITNAIFEACLTCRYKAWKILRGERGVPSLYEEMMAPLKEKHQSLATSALLKKLKISSAPSYPRLTEVSLSKRHSLILNTIVEQGQLRINVMLSNVFMIRPLLETPCMSPSYSIPRKGLGRMRNSACRWLATHSAKCKAYTRREARSFLGRIAQARLSNW